MANDCNNDAPLLSWDDLCVNPHEAHMHQGREEGRVAGLEAGYRDGYSLGKSKALEFGIELGFIRGFIGVVSSKNNHQELSERIRANIKDLTKAIDEFPSPDLLFADVTGSSRDVLEKIQRIRAKFKLLTVQLKMPNFSLKQVMKEAKDASESSTVLTTNASTDERQQEEKASSSAPGGDISSDW